MSKSTQRRRTLNRRLGRFLPLLLSFVLIGMAAGAAVRVPWTTSRIIGSPEPPPPYTLELAFPNLKFTNPVEMVSAPGSDRLFLMELGGKVVSFPNQPDVTKPDLLLDLKTAVPGFSQSYGMVFHPGFATNRFVYVCYVLQANLADGSRVSRFKVIDSNPPRVDPASEKVLITLLSGGHNGGSLHFGPDSCLYISTGDSAAPSPPDPLNTGQDISDLLSSVLRIDVDHEDNGRAYRVPKDNPFVTTPGARPEVWAFGLRNPWKMSFDRADGTLWVGDVGWDVWELVYRVQRGGNYGWSIMEGSQSIKPEGKRGPTPITPPVAQHSHVEARSITGGYVYHGERLPELAGRYIYGDWITGKIWSLSTTEARPTPREIANTPVQIICFGVDHSDELYVVGYEGGIHRLVPNPATQSGHAFPRRLSETGLFKSLKPEQVEPGVIPYRIETPLWADGATADRWIAIPNLGKLGVENRMDRMRGWIRGSWTYPENSVLVKTLSLEMERGNPATRRRIETQLLHFDGASWHPYTYRWNADQTDAELLPAGGAEQVFTVKDTQSPGGQQRLNWHFSARAECMVCHTPKSSTVLGFESQQLATKTGNAGSPIDQLSLLEQMGLFLDPVRPATLPKSSRQEIADLEHRARQYLSVNCAHCHQMGGASAATFETRDELPLDKMNLVKAPATQGDFGIENATLLTPGDPYHSILLYRMAKLGAGHMPHIGSMTVDSGGLRLIHDWIRALGETPLPHTDGDLKTIPSALAHAMELDAPTFTAKQRATEAARILSSLPPPAIRDLFDRFLPDDQRVAKLGPSIQPGQILSIKGDAARGRKLFSQEGGVQCMSCHRIQGQGNQIGPDLSEVGKRLDRTAILRSVLEPSRDIAPEWIVQMVDSRDGNTYTGFVLKRTESELTLRDVTGKELKIAMGNIDRLTASQLSLMPEGLFANLTAQEAADVVEFLANLK